MEQIIDLSVCNATTGNAVWRADASGINLPTTAATLTDWNRLMYAQPTPDAADRPAEGQPADRLFGNHIREAVAIIKDWTGSNKG